MSVSIIVLHYGDMKLTTKCVESIRATSSAEVIMVDNAAIGWYALLADELYNPGFNMGFAAGCNYGAGVMARGDTLVFLNNDTEVQPGWLEPLLAELDNPAVGVVGPKLVYPDGRLQCAGIAVNFKWRPVAEAQGIDWWAPPVSTDVQAVTGACLAVRRGVFEELGGFDEGYWNGYEDVDLCLKAGAAGYRVRYVPASVVVHHESQSDPAERFRCVRENVIRLREKWDPAWPDTANSTT